MVLLRFIGVVMGFSCCFLQLGRAAELSMQAEGLFKKYSAAIYQIQSISNEANKKNSIGSGFQIAPGYLVTNYHVVSDAVMTPASYRLEAIQADGKAQPARIINFDVVHDISIIKIDAPQEITLPLGSSEINKGKRLFSIGNPEDVGMMIIEGVANGYMDKALYKKVLTSLPLNPGMSGGPALDVEGRVAGINVMTAGNSLSFLVPVEFLKALWDKTRANHFQPVVDFTGLIQNQLIAQEGRDLEGISRGKWDRQRFGRFLVPANIANEVSCWGEPRTEEEYWLQSPYLECSIKDNLYISSTVMAHGVSYNYSWVKSRGYNPFRFYTLTNQAFIKQYRFDLDNAGERDVENFVCRTDIVNIASTPFWVSTCGRKLKKLPKLYDVNIRMASLGQMDRMMMIEVTLGAVTKKTAKSFINKFYQELEWTKSSSK